MKVSQKADYALRAMLDLALHGSQRAGGKAIRTSDVAGREEIPEKFLEAILVELRKAGLLVSQRGPDGGYKLAKDASEITIGEIWRAIDGQLTPRADKLGQKDETLGLICFKSVWDQVEQAVNQVVDAITLAELCQRGEDHRSVLNFSI